MGQFFIPQVGGPHFYLHIFLKMLSSPASPSNVSQLGMQNTIMVFMIFSLLFAAACALIKMLVVIVGMAPAPALPF